MLSDTDSNIKNPFTPGLMKIKDKVLDEFYEQLEAFFVKYSLDNVEPNPFIMFDPKPLNNNLYVKFKTYDNYSTFRLYPQNFYYDDHIILFKKYGINVFLPNKIVNSNPCKSSALFYYYSCGAILFKIP